MELRSVAHILALADEVADFLRGCPSPASPYAGTGIHASEKDLLECIAWGQYCLTRDADGTITGFMSYWKISPDALPLLMAGEAADKCGGSHAYIVDAGCRGGGFRQLCRQVQRKAAPFTGTGFYRHKGQRRSLYTRGTLAKG